MRQRNLSADAARMARAAAGDLASLHRAMRSAQDSMAGLNRALKVATIKTKRGVIKGSTNTSFLTTLFGGLSSSFSASNGDGFTYTDSGISYNSAQDTSSPDSFYQSDEQTASNYSIAFKLGQRIL